MGFVKILAKPLIFSVFLMGSVLALLPAWAMSNKEASGLCMPEFGNGYLVLTSHAGAQAVGLSIEGLPRDLSTLEYDNVRIRACATFVSEHGDEHNSARFLSPSEALLQTGDNLDCARHDLFSRGLCGAQNFAPTLLIDALDCDTLAQSSVFANRAKCTDNIHIMHVYLQGLYAQIANDPRAQMNPSGMRLRLQERKQARSLPMMLTLALLSQAFDARIEACEDESCMLSAYISQAIKLRFVLLDSFVDDQASFIAPWFADVHKALASMQNASFHMKLFLLAAREGLLSQRFFEVRYRSVIVRTLHQNFAPEDNFEDIAKHSNSWSEMAYFIQKAKEYGVVYDDDDYSRALLVAQQIDYIPHFIALGADINYANHAIVRASLYHSLPYFRAVLDAGADLDGYHYWWQDSLYLDTRIFTDFSFPYTQELLKRRDVSLFSFPSVLAAIARHCLAQNSENATRLRMCEETSVDLFVQSKPELSAVPIPLSKASDPTSVKVHELIFYARAQGQKQGGDSIGLTLTQTKNRCEMELGEDVYRYALIADKDVHGFLAVPLRAKESDAFEPKWCLGKQDVLVRDYGCTQDANACRMSVLLKMQAYNQALLEGGLEALGFEPDGREHFLHWYDAKASHGCPQEDLQCQIQAASKLYFQLALVAQPFESHHESHAFRSSNVLDLHARTLGTPLEELESFDVNFGTVDLLFEEFSGVSRRCQTRASIEYEVIAQRNLYITLCYRDLIQRLYAHVANFHESTIQSAVIVDQISQASGFDLANMDMNSPITQRASQNLLTLTQTGLRKAFDEIAYDLEIISENMRLQMQHNATLDEQI